MSVAPPSSCAFCEFPNTLGPHSPADCIDFLLRDRDRLRAQLAQADDLRTLVSWMVAATHSTVDSIPADAQAQSQAADILALRAKLARVEAERDDLRQRLTTISHMHHFPDAECQNAECVICGVLDCRWAEPLHYHHDSCPAEYHVERERDDARRSLDALRAQVQAAEGLREAVEAYRKHGLTRQSHGPCDGTCSSCEMWRAERPRLQDQIVSEALAAYDAIKKENS
jgi:hypothetical protein